MYKVFYYLNDHRYGYNFLFNSLWAATFKARAIYEEHGCSSEVEDTGTGALMVTFDKYGTYVDSDIEPAISALACTPLK